MHNEQDIVYFFVCLQDRLLEAYVCMCIQKNKPHTFVRIQVMRFSVGGNDLLKVKYIITMDGSKVVQERENIMM